MIDIPCVIFAGGKSSRMGRDKALLPFGKCKTLTQYQLQNLNKIFKNVYISCRTKDKFDFDAHFIEDIKNNDNDLVYAPTAGFIATFEVLDTEKFFAISVDTPFITKKEITEIVKSDKESVDAVIAQTEFGIQPLCGIYHKSLELKFKNMQELGNHKLGFLLRSSKTIFIKFDDEKPFLNLNYPQEYKEAQQISLQTH